jgi:hypothetical protein
MHATELLKPFHRDGWVYKEKYDGWRMVAEKFVNKTGAEAVLKDLGGFPLAVYGTFEALRRWQRRGGVRRSGAEKPEPPWRGRCCLRCG